MLKTRLKLISLGIIGILLLVLLTWKIGYTYISMVRSLPQKDSSIIKSNTFTMKEGSFILPRLDFWTCQVGVFQSEENARQETERLKKLGWEARILTKNPWSVGVGLGYSQAELTPLHDALKVAGITALTKHVMVNERAFRIAGNNVEQTVTILQSVNVLLRTGFMGDKTTEKAILNKEFTQTVPKELEGLRQAWAVLNQKGLSYQEQKVYLLVLYAEYQVALEKMIK